MSDTARDREKIMCKQLAVLVVVLVAVGAVAAPAVTAAAAVVAVAAAVAVLHRTATRRPVPARATNTAWARVCGLHVTARTPAA